MSKNKQAEAWEKEIDYLFSHGGTNPPYTNQHIQDSGSKYANQFTKDVLKTIIAQVAEQARAEAYKKVVADLDGFLNKYTEFDCDDPEEIRLIVDFASAFKRECLKAKPPAK